MCRTTEKRNVITTLEGEGPKKNGRSSEYENRKRVEEPEDVIIKVDVKKTNWEKCHAFFAKKI